ncbi:putative phage tail protein [Paenibacillus planticolens]|uniref:DUF2313 domain-containing protein n=1 Tax=Paenibacillus planticolens TaxID=2654976 RepID=A0ABX1ZR40_9BACL|nr:putative phage tail protein [Paenibacillus planticolens]NOV01338.1 DUF2313 domain-containing protein [Paenibacillus planticolens]
MKFFDFFQSILPGSFLHSAFKNTVGIYKAVGRQFDDLKAAVSEARDQLFIDSATYMLPVYEAEFAIQLLDKSNIPARRNNVMAMSRGGIGATSADLKSILQAYGYTTNIVEDFGNYKVTIQFTDVRGIPSNINDLKGLMSRFMPGHLRLEWQYIYTQYQEFQPFTHNKMRGFTHEYLRNQVPTM